MSETSLTIYLDEPLKRELREAAEAEDRSMSDYCRHVLQNHLKDKHSKELTAQTRVEERIEELISIGIDELTQTARQIADMNAKMGVYSVANFEMIKQNHPDALRRDALATGSRRLRDELGAEILDDIDAAPPADHGTGADDAADGDPVFDLDRDRERIERGGRK
jgi:plasmid stability protein